MLAKEQEPQEKFRFQIKGQSPDKVTGLGASEMSRYEEKQRGTVLN